MRYKLKGITAAVLAALLLSLVGCGKGGDVVTSSGGDGGAAPSQSGGTASGGQDGVQSGDGEQSAGGQEETGGDEAGEAFDATGGYADYVKQQYKYRDIQMDRKTIAGKFAIYFFRSDAYPDTGAGTTLSGDCSLLVAPTGETMLIDMNIFGSNAFALDCLERLGIKKIDYLVASHPDGDHVHGYKAFLDNIQVGRLYVNPSLRYQSPGVVGNALYQTAVEKGIPVTVLQRGDPDLHLGDVKIEIWNPRADRDWQKEYNENTQNAGSLGFAITYKKATVWFGGDLETPQELDMIETYGPNIHFDVAKMNHHGVNQQNSANWVNAISPTIAVGETNAVNDDGVFMRYVNSGALTLHTNLDGTVLVTTSGDDVYDVYTEHDRTNAYYGIFADIQNGHIRVKGK